MEKEQFQSMLQEGLTTLGLFKDGKPTFVTAADFGKTAAIINDLKKAAGSALTADQLVELGVFEKDGDGKLKLKTAAVADPKAGGSGGAGDDKLEELRKKFETELAARDKKLRERDEALEAERKARETAETNRAIQEALTKAGALNPSRDYIHLASGVKRKEDGTLVATTKDKWGADQEIGLDDYANQWLESNKELKRATTQQGSGAPGGGSPGALPANTVPKSKMSDTAWYMANRDKIMSGEIKIANQ